MAFENTSKTHDDWPCRLVILWQPPSGSLNGGLLVLERRRFGSFGLGSSVFVGFDCKNLSWGFDGTLSIVTLANVFCRGYRKCLTPPTPEDHYPTPSPSEENPPKGFVWQSCCFGCCLDAFVYLLPISNFWSCCVLLAFVVSQVGSS